MQILQNFYENQSSFITITDLMILMIVPHRLLAISMIIDRDYSVPGVRTAHHNGRLTHPSF